MKKPVRQPDGLYHIGGKTFELLVGSRAQVWHGTAYKTAGGSHGLTRSQLRQNKSGEIVSLNKSISATKEKRLQKHGWFTQKGKFGSHQKTSKRKSKRKD
jgi:fructose-1,6-bisphosphatase